MRPSRPQTDRSASRSPAPAAAPTSPGASAAVPDGPPPVLDLRLIRELAKVVSQYQLTEISLQLGGGRVRLRRGGDQQLPLVTPPAGAALVTPLPTPAPAAPAAAVAAAPAPVTDLVEITSPFVGTFYRAPNPDATPYVEVGTRFRKGQVLCIVEAMKLMNEIESEIAGTIVEIVAQNGRPVEYGEPLFKVRAG